MIAGLVFSFIVSLPGQASAETMTPAEAQAALDRAVVWLLEHQGADGAWASSVMETVQEYGFSVESFYAWQVAAHALACMALAEVDETPERRAALERGLRWLCAAREPKRGSDWDTDYGWAALYGFVATVRAARDPRFQEGDWPASIEAAGRRFLDILLRIQSPTGGWAYYDARIFSRRPTWDTSFCTALVLPALAEALKLGWLEDLAVLERAQRYVRRCALPNGAYSYDLDPVPRWNAGEHIDDVKGSLSRIQVCNWGLAESGVRKITAERIRAGLDQLLRHHRFLDVGRMRPIPHEAYYYNAGYFYLFGHYYAAEAIELLPAEEREGYHARLRPHLIRAQRGNGRGVDFLDVGYQAVAGTAYLALGLSLGLPEPVGN